MINPEELGQSPLFRETPTLTDAEAVDAFRKNIQFMADKVENSPGDNAISSHELFSFSLDSIRGKVFIWNPIVHYAGKIDLNRVQELAFKAMGEFGFNADVHEEVKKRGRKSPLNEHGASELVVVTTYPSQTIKGLAFQRIMYCDAGNNNRPYGVGWSVIDQTSIGKNYPFSEK